jgi:ribosomal protein S18 acetylase RimI-like enzyme
MRESDFPQALAVWQACFGDEESYVRFFWEHCFPLCRGLAWEEGGRLVSMLFLLPCALVRKSLRLPAEYVYAVATLPEYRGRGCAAALTRHAAALAKAEGKSALCLRPADEGLYGYYAKLGFVKAFAKQERASRHGSFGWESGVRGYIQKESELTGRELHPARSPGGMLLPLDGRAHEFLRKTKGRAYMGSALE